MFSVLAKNDFKILKMKFIRFINSSHQDCVMTKKKTNSHKLNINQLKILKKPSMQRNYFSFSFIPHFFFSYLYYYGINGSRRKL